MSFTALEIYQYFIILSKQQITIVVAAGLPLFIRFRQNHCALALIIQNNLIEIIIWCLIKILYPCFTAQPQYMSVFLELRHIIIMVVELWCPKLIIICWPGVESRK